VRVVAGGHLGGARVAGEPLSGLGVELAEQDRGAAGHRLAAGSVRAEHDHLTGSPQLFGGGRILACVAAREPPHHRSLRDRGRGELAHGGQALCDEDHRNVGEPGDGGLDDLGRRLDEIQAAAEPGRRIAEPAWCRLRPGALREHQRAAADPFQPLPADREPPRA
jgi:hypothetical protein